jgi:hypothetical protein
MSNFVSLDPAAGCHPVLPAHKAADVVTFATLLPVAIPKGSAREGAELPLLKLLPRAMEDIEVASGRQRDEIRRLAGVNKPMLTPEWEVEPDSVATEPRKAVIGSVGTLLLSRVVEVDGEPRPVDVDAAAARALAEGRPTRLRLRGGAPDEVREVLVEPDLGLPDGDYVIFLDGDGQDELFTKRSVMVARAGRKEVALNGDEIDLLLRTGEAVTRFADNDEATLRMVLQPPGATGPVPQFVFRADPAVLPASGGEIELNLADRVELRMGSTSSAMMGTSISGGFISGGRAFVPQAGAVAVPSGQGVGAASPPPPPARSGTLPPPPALPGFPVVLYVPYRQQWLLQGYARGDLLNTLSLAPQEETTIEVFSWERRRREEEESTGTENESSLEGTLHNKDTTEVVDEARRENGWKLDAGLEVSIPSSPVNGSIDFGVKDELTTTAKTTATQIAEATLKAATKVKATRQTKVVETSEFGTETKVIRRLRNPNAGRTLNLDIFEVVAGYNVTTTVDRPGVRLAVLVPMHDFLAPIINRSPTQYLALLSFRDVIEPAVPPSMRAGFAAARMLLAYHRQCELMCKPSCSCESSPTPPQDPGANRAGGTQGREASLLAEIADTVQRARRAIEMIARAGVATLGLVIKRNLEGWLQDPPDRPTEQEFAAARSEVRRYLFRRFVMNGPAARFWSEAQALLAAGDGEAAARQIIAARSVQGVDALNAATTFVTLQARVVAEAIDIIGSGWPLVLADMATRLGFEDAGMESALEQMQRALVSLDELRNPPPAKDQGKAEEKDRPDPIDAVKTAQEKEGFSVRELAAATIDFDILIAHLSNNANAFRTRLWQSIDPADRLRILAIYGSLPGRTTGRILGFSGTSVVLELNLAGDAKLQELFASAVISNGGLAEVNESFDAVLPTPGVALESRLGSCDALEPFLTESRTIELDRLRQVAGQQALEVERMKARISEKLLDDPKPAGPVLITERTPSP